jgi:hypothetical protein
MYAPHNWSAVAFFPLSHGVSHHASLQCKADVAVLVVSVESQEFAVCMADCSSASLFETALLIKFDPPPSPFSSASFCCSVC